MKDQYTDAIHESCSKGIWKTARDVDPIDMDSVSHKIRYRTKRLGLQVTITTDKEERTVSFLVTVKGNDSSG
jgi:hypothetical protein